MPQSSTHNNSARQRCFLCDLPKTPWAMVHEFTEPVCRGCVNYEGSSYVPNIINSAMQLKGNIRNQSPGTNLPSVSTKKAVDSDCSNSARCEGSNAFINGLCSINPEIVVPYPTDPQVANQPTGSIAIGSAQFVMQPNPIAVLASLTGKLLSNGAAGLDLGWPYSNATSKGLFSEKMDLQERPLAPTRNHTSSTGVTAAKRSNSDSGSGVLSKRRQQTAPANSNSENSHGGPAIAVEGARDMKGEPEDRKAQLDDVLMPHANGRAEKLPSDTKIPKKSERSDRASTIATLCFICRNRLVDTHYVQCPSFNCHKFCFGCTGVAIRKQCVNGDVACPSGNRCLLAGSGLPWAFTREEIATILAYREVKSTHPTPNDRSTMKSV